MSFSKLLSSAGWVAAGVALAFLLGHPASTTAPRKETAYERVMRTRTLRCGYGLWPVTEEIDPNTKKLKGLVPEMTEALGQKLGLKIEWVEEIAWGTQTAALDSGRIDALCSTDGPWNYSSTAVVDYAEPMLYFPVFLYGREDGPRFKDISQANNTTYTFSAIEGDISLAMPLDRFPKAKRLELSGSADASLILANVLTHKADFVLTDALTIDQSNKNNEKKLVKLYEQPLATINMSFSVAKGQGDLLNMLNQGFKLLQQLGISDEILDKYDPAHKLFLRPVKRWEP